MLNRVSGLGVGCLGLGTESFMALPDTCSGLAAGLREAQGSGLGELRGSM